MGFDSLKKFDKNFFICYICINIYTFMKMKIKREYGISLHYQIRKEIEKYIKENDFNDKPIPQEEKLAKIFNVSRGTVRRAILDLVNQGVLYRIPGKGTFVNKRTLSIEKITILSPWHLHKDPEIAQNSYEDILMRELRKIVIKSGYTIILRDFDREEIEFIGITKESSGIIILNPTKNHEEIINRMSKFKIPVVFIGANLERNDLNYVAVENKSGIRQAIDYLISLNHKYLFFIGGSPESYDTYERYEEFIDYCKKKKVKSDAVIIESHLNWEKEVEKIVYEYYENKNLPDAFITGGITLSLYLMDAVKKIKKKIPDDLSLIGFDDFPICSHLNPPLTTIFQPIDLLAKTGFELLEKRIKNPFLKPKQIILPTKLIIRNSCKKGGEV